MSYNSKPRVKFSKIPIHQHISSILLKVFRCSSFIRVPQQFKSKFDLNIIKCFFLGNIPNKKRYKCHSPITKKFYHSTNIILFENKLLYSKNNVSGKSGNTEEHLFGKPRATPKNKIPNLLS